MPLTEQEIKKARASGKPRRCADGKGLYLLLNPNGSRWWRMDYQHAGKRKTLSMGIYPHTSLKAAREKCETARQLLATGIDPSEHRKAQRAVGTGNVRAIQGRTPRVRLANKAPISSGWPASLEAVGIDKMEEAVYRFLLANRMATSVDVAQMLSLSSRKAQQLLDSIEMKGLVTHSPERPRRYIAASPKLAVEALISQRHLGLEQVRSTIPELTEYAESSSDTDDREQVVELITSRASLAQVFKQLMHTIQDEALAFQRAPRLYNQSTMPAGVRTRTITDAGFLASPGALELLRQDVKNGEEARVFPMLPVKMLIADRRIGLIPLNTENPDGPILLVRASSLLDALRALFDLTWERATPVLFTRAGKLETGPVSARLSSLTDELIPLLAAGLNDKAIAYEAGISGTTLSRRVNELMRAMDTRTRFQLGWRAAMETFSGKVPTDATSASS